MKKKYSPKPLLDTDWPEKYLKTLTTEMKSKPGVIYASSLGDEARVLYLKFRGLVNDTVDFESSVKMENGNLLHERFGKNLERAKLLVVKEKPLPPHTKYFIHGRLDFEIKKPFPDPDTRLFLIEFKTTTTELLSRLSEPYFSALCQWAYYSDRESIPQGFITYEAEAKRKWFYVERVGTSLQVHYKNEKIADWPDFLPNLYQKVAYALHCERIGRIPEKCTECALKECKHPDLCEQEERSQEVLLFKDWKLQS